MSRTSAVTIRFIKLSGTEEDNCAIEALTQSLPVQLQTAIARMKYRKHRIIRATGWLMLNFQLLQIGYGTDALAALRTTAYGKPYLPGPSNFSISYTGNYAICTLAPINKLGIDIEFISDIDISDLKRYFNETEWSSIVKSDDPQKCFFQFWTRKESVLKADGRGLHVDLRDVSVDKTTCRINGSATRYYLTNLPEIGNNVAGTVCTDQPEAIPAVERIEIDHLRYLTTLG